jgi:hypothetical protein
MKKQTEGRKGKVKKKFFTQRAKGEKLNGTFEPEGAIKTI